jgi:hypothetical protein
VRYVAGERPPVYVIDREGVRWRVFDVVPHRDDDGSVPYDPPSRFTRHDPPAPRATSREFLRADRLMRIASFAANGRGIDEASLRAQLASGYFSTHRMKDHDAAELRLPTLGGSTGRGEATPNVQAMLRPDHDRRA